MQTALQCVVDLVSTLSRFACHTQLGFFAVVLLRWNVTGSSRPWANRQANMCTGSTYPSQTAHGSGCRKATFTYSRLATRAHTFGSSTLA